MFLALFPFAAPYPVVWLFALPFALAQGVTLSAADRLSAGPDRQTGPAPEARCWRVNSVIAQSTVAMIFALGTAIAGYWLADVLAAAAILAARRPCWSRVERQR